MNSVAERPADTVEASINRTSIPQHIIVAYHEAMTRDGRMAAIAVIEGRGHAVKDVAAAAHSMYGTQDETR
jgi:hypothetical protein